MDETQESTLDNILTGEAPTGVVEDSPPESEDTIEAQEETPAEDVEATEEPEAQSEEPAKVPVAALADERGKRQAQERENDELRARLKALTEPEQPEEPAKEIDFLDDPDGWRNQFLNQVNQNMEAVRQEARQNFLSMVGEAARAQHDDYDDAISHFAQAVQQNPALAAEANAQPNPAEYAYQAGLNLKMLNDGGGDLDSLLQRTREQAVADYLKSNKPEKESLAAVPESLSNMTGANKPQTKVESNSLDSIVGNNL